ncbi:MAG: hypothetical protein JXB10_16705 [Pirellulales bacterium]|nr:hypothetical protein [Pirellulales bacterium]
MNLLQLKYRMVTWSVGLLLPTVLGCGDSRPARVPVSGRVLIDGKPLETGFIQVYPKGNRPASSPIASDGSFTLTTFDDHDGCVIGKHRVAVQPQKVINATTTKWFAPKKYTNRKTSGLEIEVNGPRDDLEINLTWQGSGHDKPYVEVEKGVVEENIE